MIKRLRKYEEAVMKSKGHRHLYDRFETLVKDLRALPEWDAELTGAVTGVVHQLLYEAGVTACTPFYPLYSCRCWACADTLHALLREKDSSVTPDTLIREIEDLLLDKKVMIYMNDTVWATYTRELSRQERWRDIRTLIAQSVAAADGGRRPRNFQTEQSFFNQLRRASILIHQYIRLTGDRTCLKDWCDACNLNHHQNILYNLIKNNGDIRIIGLLIHSISTIEELEIL